VGMCVYVGIRLCVGMCVFVTPCRTYASQFPLVPSFSLSPPRSSPLIYPFPHTYNPIHTHTVATISDLLYAQAAGGSDSAGSSAGENATDPPPSSPSAPALVIIDSVQTMQSYSGPSSGGMGSVGQVHYTLYTIYYTLYTIHYTLYTIS
jgi:hypothetical protein